MRNVPCVAYLGAENLCLVENAWGNITSDQMTMIKISFFPPFPPQHPPLSSFFSVSLLKDVTVA